MYVNHGGKKGYSSHFHIFYIDNTLSDFINLSCSVFYFCSAVHIFLELSFYLYMNLTASFVNLKKIRVAICSHKQN